MPKQVAWVKNTQNNDWFDFLRLNLDAPYFFGKKGVYVIWYTSPGIAKVVRVGSGVLADRLKEHRSNPEITKYSNSGQLKVSWVVVDKVAFFEHEMEGAEKYLARVYSPLVGDRFPNIPEVPINLIGQA
jgi:hypothetical protein